MAEYVVDITSKPGIVYLRLSGCLSVDEMKRFVAEHDAAIAALNGTPYRVFCDLRELTPLSPECTALLSVAKSFSARQPNFQGSAVWVSSSVVSMQHRRTSQESGVMDTELISDDEGACWRHLRRVNRRASKVD
jgi:hypothetical protein